MGMNEFQYTLHSVYYTPAVNERSSYIHKCRITFITFKSLGCVIVITKNTFFLILLLWALEDEMIWCKRNFYLFLGDCKKCVCMCKACQNWCLQTNVLSSHKFTINFKRKYFKMSCLICICALRLHILCGVCVVCVSDIFCIHANIMSIILNGSFVFCTARVFSMSSIGHRTLNKSKIYDKI